MAAAVLAWPVLGWIIAWIKEGTASRDPTPYVWSAAIGSAAGIVLIVIASLDDPTTPTQGMRDLGLALLGMANLTGAVLSGAIAGIRRWRSGRSWGSR